MKLEKLLGEVFSINNSEKKRSEKNQNASDRYHAKRIAKKLNITITVERDPCGWCAWIWQMSLKVTVNLLLAGKKLTIIYKVLNL